MKHKQSKNYLIIFLLLIIIFLAPLIIAVLLYNKNPLWLHKKTINKGYLLSSNVNLQQLMLTPIKSSSKTFNQSWFLFYLAQSPCQKICQKKLHLLRQIILALGKNSSRVKYGVILTNDKPLIIQTLIKQDSNLQIYKIYKSEINKYDALLKLSKYSNGYYLADRFGKIILYYTSNTQGEDIYKDLSRLLTISTTG